MSFDSMSNTLETQLWLVFGTNWCVLIRPFVRIL